MRKLKTCCVCGQSAGRHHQWYNRDTGFGICPACAKSELQKLDPDEFESYYGKPGMHFSLDEESSDCLE